MRIVFVADDIDAVGGIQTATHTLAQHLTSRGHHVHVVGLYRNPNPADPPDPSRYQRTVLHAPPPQAPADPRRLACAKRQMRQILDACQVAVMSSVHTSLWLHDLPGSSARPVRVGHYHGSYEYARGHYHLSVIRDLWPRLDAAVFLSPDDAAGFAAHARLRTSWIPNPLPPATGSPTPARRLSRVVAVGRLATIKRFDLAITAFTRAAVPGWQLHLIGDGDQEHTLRNLAEPAGDAVVFRGRLAAADMPDEYAAAQLLVMTSAHEGFGMVIAEACAAGTPSVAFNVSGGVRSLVRHDHTGLLVPPGDLDALTQALGTL
ncbi:glycosyltransferase, partial [Micromonosporaceae bacterium Da 78-11]